MTGVHVLPYLLNHVLSHKTQSPSSGTSRGTFPIRFNCHKSASLGELMRCANDFTASAMDGSSCAKYAARITYDLNFFFMSASGNVVLEFAICFSTERCSAGVSTPSSFQSQLTDQDSPFLLIYNPARICSHHDAEQPGDKYCMSIITRRHAPSRCRRTPTSTACPRCCFLDIIDEMPSEMPHRSLASICCSALFLAVMSCSTNRFL